ncbi:hypothetical protein MC378_02715 [Polaribacter sp. MSW13]|uniref:MORN repeat protein n=1 Tax=Polaribacter marinus TaxID=2916838 RepID=A0A9X1VL62_9FLAO|nr:hypothetical protein [Polaribacter marinus]MCI2228065.1 hypothetical protein [Polaribacter marinus]
MKKASLLLILFLFFQSLIYSQNGICEGGNCKNGFGHHYIKTTNEIYHGYFKDAKYNGIGMYSNNEGMYYSQFTNGKMNGYTVYYQKGNISAGNFINGIKNGVHFINADKQGSIDRIVVTYEKGKELSREFLKVTSENFNSGKDCISGDCDNGNGIFLIKAQNVLVIGKFEKNAMVEGEYLNIQYGESDYFAVPKDLTNPYFKFSKLPMKEGGLLEIAAMYITSKKNGQAVMYQTKSKEISGVIYKNDELVK